MGKEDKKRERQIEEQKKRLREQCSDYVNAVTLISSVEAWFRFRWGPEGVDPGRLKEFDRFPDLNGSRPDFLAHFTTPYVLCGEHVKTFRRGAGGARDAKQLLRYSRWQPPKHHDSKVPGYDVLLLVGTYSDDIAAEEMELATRTEDAGAGARAPVVIVGYYREQERVEGEWYNLKWRNMRGNSRFTDPNVTTVRRAEDLNSLITEATHCPIPVDAKALDLSCRNPFINDPPPPVYTLVRIVFPAINWLLSNDERDELQREGKVKKTVSRADILGAPMLSGLHILEAHVQNAFDWLVERKLAMQVGTGQSRRYLVTVRGKTWKDFETIFQRAARAIVGAEETKRRRSRRRKGEHPGQKKFA